MANYSTNLKTWGSTGSEYPDSYNYVEGEQPVDAWDNFVNHNLITDVQHLISLTNDRLESDAGTSRPSTPENGHLFHDTGNGELEWYDSAESTWESVMPKSGGTFTASINMGGRPINDSTGTLTIGAGLDVNGAAAFDGAALQHAWFSKQEGGTVNTGTSVPVGSFELADNDTLYVTQAMLTEDGFTTPAPSGLNLLIVPNGSSNTTILSGDGTTLYLNETGTPYASYTNTTGSTQEVAIMLDNGDYGSGVGSDTSGYGGYIARVA